MMSFTRPFSIFFLCLLAKVAFSQGSNEIGIGGGVSYYVGDLNPGFHFNPNFLHGTFGLKHRFNANERVTWVNQFNFAQVSGDDALSNNPWQVNRNLAFESRIIEGNSSIEFNFFKFDVFSPKRTLTPYSFIGLGLFWFNPIGELNGNIYELQPLTTEGQADPYSRLQLNIPFGIGLKFKIAERWNGDLHWSMRRLFTDYLDDVSGFYPTNPSNLSTVGVGLSNKAIDQDGANNTNWGSQRGLSSSRDWYAIFGLTISYRLTENPSACHFNPLNL